MENKLIFPIIKEKSFTNHHTPYIIRRPMFRNKRFRAKILHGSRAVTHFSCLTKEELFTKLTDFIYKLDNNLCLWCPAHNCRCD